MPDNPVIVVMMLFAVELWMNSVVVKVDTE